MASFTVTARVTDRLGAWAEAVATAAFLDQQEDDEMTTTVATADAPSWVKARYRLTGTNDVATLQAAVDEASALASRGGAGSQTGQVVVGGGRVAWDDTLLMRTGVTLSGQGNLTEFLATGLAGKPMLGLASPDVHLTTVRDVWFNGNSSAGGTGNIIDYDMSGSGNTSTYPDRNPDAGHRVRHCRISNHVNTNNDAAGVPAARTAIKMWASATANNRANFITENDISQSSGHAIWLKTASDSFITGCHLENGKLSGVRVEAGNTKVSEVKVCYYDGIGFELLSGRHTVTGCEAQDNAVGVQLSATDLAVAGLTIDSCSTAGLAVANSQASIAGLHILNRSGGRYATQAAGITFAGSLTDLVIHGSINPAGITAPVPTSGLPTAANRNVIRIPYGSGLLSVN